VKPRRAADAMRRIIDRNSAHSGVINSDPVTLQKPSETLDLTNVFGGSEYVAQLVEQRTFNP
jgi:hypothetical protein